MAQTDNQHRPIRSFIRREGRLTPGQQKALHELWPVYGVDLQGQQPEFAQVFPDNRPVVLEIGFGNGESLAQAASRHPEVNFLGVEVHQAGIGHLLLELASAQLTNVRLINQDVMEILSGWLPENCLDAVWLFFPDPWPKKKHHKRRIVTRDFLNHVAHCLKPQGILHMATDWQDYAEHMQNELKRDIRFKLEVPVAGLPEDSVSRHTVTKFERRGLKKGHSISDLLYRFCPEKQA